MSAARGLLKCAALGTAIGCAIVIGAVLAGIDCARSEWGKR